MGVCRRPLSQPAAMVEACRPQRAPRSPRLPRCRYRILLSCLAGILSRLVLAGSVRAGDAVRRVAGAGNDGDEDRHCGVVVRELRVAQLLLPLAKFHGAELYALSSSRIP